MHKNNFDFLRLFAALLVLLSHQFVVCGLTQPLVFDLRAASTVAVYIFFAISGYLISQSWIRAPHLGVFVENRIVRIWPGFAAVTILSALVLGPLVTTSPLRDYFFSPMTREYVMQLTFDMRYKLPGAFEANAYPGMVSSSTWTIPFEIQWYCVVALLGVLGILSRRWMVNVICFLFVAYVCVKAVRLGAQDGAYPQELGACFLMGVMLSTVNRELLAYRRFVFVGTVGLAALAAWAGLGMVGLLVFLPVIAIAFGEGRNSPLIVFGSAGDFSYGLYLWAWPVQQSVAWATDNRLSYLSSLAIVVPLSLGCAILSWRYVERPAMRWKDRRRRLIGQASAIPA